MKRRHLLAGCCGALAAGLFTGLAVRSSAGYALGEGLRCCSKPRRTLTQPIERGVHATTQLHALQPVEDEQRPLDAARLAQLYRH